MTKFWRLSENVTVPVHVHENPRTGEVEHMVLSRKELDQAFPANPYTLWGERFSDVCGACVTYMKRLSDERLRQEAIAIREVGKLQPFQDKMTYTIRRALFLEDYVEFCDYLCSEWRTLTLDRAKSMKAVYAAGIDAEDWFSLWRALFKTTPAIVSLAVPASKRGQIKDFADAWADSVGDERSDAAAHVAQEQPAQPQSVVPQVIMDHSCNDDMLGNRTKHRITANASVEYTLTFEADEAQLKKVVDLLDLEHNDAIDGCQVKGNFVRVLMRADVLDSYPAKGGTDIVAMDRMHQVVDDIYNELWELLAHLQVLESKRLMRRLGHDDNGVH